MRKIQCYNKHYIPSATRQNHLLQEEKKALHNKVIFPLEARRTVLSSTTLSASSYFTLGVLLSSAILPVVAGGGANTVPVTTRDVSIPKNVTGCTHLVHSLGNTEQRAGCLLVSGNNSSFNAICNTAFDSTHVEKQKKPSDSGVNYRSTRLMELCVNKSTALRLQEEGLCETMVEDPLTRPSTADTIYNIGKQTGLLEIDSVQCTEKASFGISANEESVSSILKEQNCHIVTEERALKEYAYPTQETATVISPGCPTSLTFISDGIDDSSSKKICIPTNIRNGRSLCNDSTSLLQNPCPKGITSTARDCVFGSNAYAILKKACPRVKVSDIHAMHHQRIGSQNITQPMLSATSLSKSLDTILQQKILPQAVYITHPGTPLYTTYSLTKIVQESIDMLVEGGCTVIFDKCKQQLHTSDIFYALKNVTYVESMKEALESNLFPESRRHHYSLLAVLLLSPLLLVSFKAFLFKKTKDADIQEGGECAELLPIAIVPVLENDEESLNEETSSITQAVVEAHGGEDTVSSTGSMLYIDDEEDEESLNEETSFITQAVVEAHGGEDTVSSTGSMLYIDNEEEVRKFDNHDIRRLRERGIPVRYVRKLKEF